MDHLSKCLKERWFISVNDLLNEVNKDSIRFMMLNRSHDVELEFDFDKILEKSKETPFFMFSIVTQEFNQSLDPLIIKLKKRKLKKQNSNLINMKKKY